MGKRTILATISDQAGNLVQEVSVGDYNTMLVRKDRHAIAKMLYHRFYGRYIKSFLFEDDRYKKHYKHGFTLVLEKKPNGAPCRVAFAVSKRAILEDAICDLRCREGTNLANIGFCLATDEEKFRGRYAESVSGIRSWAEKANFDAVVWTDLASNFETKSITKKPFSVAEAIVHLQSLGPEGKSKAAEYVWRAPDFVQTPLRAALQSSPWFAATDAEAKVQAKISPVASPDPESGAESPDGGSGGSAGNRYRP